eukprot:1599406-Prymnesium_polylepis.1
MLAVLVVAECEAERARPKPGSWTEKMLQPARSPRRDVWRRAPAHRVVPDVGRACAAARGGRALLLPRVGGPPLGALLWLRRRVPARPSRRRGGAPRRGPAGGGAQPLRAGDRPRVRVLRALLPVTSRAG